MVKITAKCIQVYQVDENVERKKDNGQKII